jgi:hypothetical protein
VDCARAGAVPGSNPGGVLVWLFIRCSRILVHAKLSLPIALSLYCNISTTLFFRDVERRHELGTADSVVLNSNPAESNLLELARGLV